MRRLISLVILSFCSLIAFDISYAASQTWRLTSDSYSDSLPRIIIDNQDQIWVEWLSNAQGNYDVCYRRYNAGWSSRGWLTNDDVDQISCDITCNKVTGSVWTAWDSSGKIQYTVYSGSWYGTYTAIDSVFTFPQYRTNGRISIMAGDSGTKFLSWTADDTTGYHSVYIMRYDSGSWGQPTCVLQGNGMSMLYDNNCLSQSLALNQYQHPAVLCHTISWSMGGFFGESIQALCWSPDSSWEIIDLFTKEVGIGYDSYNNLLTIFCDSFSNGSGTLKCNKYSQTDYQYLNTYILQINAKVHSGSVSRRLCPVAVWSDSQKIYASAFCDTMWSATPMLVSDSTLNACINPDIVVQNDSTMWVCYQSDCEIYVTKTSVPLGVSGKPEIINKPVTFTVASWPNPARNKINIQCNGIDNKNTKAKIYNITGQLVKNIDIKGNQTVWNCTDQNGKKVTAGIYILNVISGNESKIQKISIIR